MISYLIHNNKEGSPKEGKERAEGGKDNNHDNNMNAHRLVQYFFLDVASAMESGQQPQHLPGSSKWAELISESLIKFPSAFSVPPSLIKLTQAFWLLDHGEFEDAMAMLLDPLVVPR